MNINLKISIPDNNVNNKQLSLDKYNDLSKDNWPSVNLINVTYKISRQIGKSLISTVYKGYNIEKKPIAIKEYTEDFKHMYIKEVKFLKHFSKSDKFVQIIDYFYENNKYYIIMEYIEGTLYDLFYQYVFTPKNIKKIIYFILLAVQELHKNNIVHLDLKPQNIGWVTLPNDVILIKIFGFSMAEYIKDINPEIIKQTLPYRAVNDFIVKKVTTKTDIWSLGCIFYEIIVTSKLFYELDENNTIAKNLLLINDALNDRRIENIYHEEFVDFIQKMVYIDESDRCTADEAIEHKWFSNIIKK